jgi:5-methyltetrahydropteroyltriglutamate--homocysteine methyltransferase
MTNSRNVSQALNVPEVQVHEPALALSDASDLQSAFESSYAVLSAAGVPINLVTYYDDIGSAYEWAVRLPVAVSWTDRLTKATRALPFRCAASPSRL